MVAIPHWRTRARAHLQDPLYLHSYLLIAATGVSATTGFVFWVAAAHLSSTASVGRAAALLSAVSLLSYLTSLGLPYGMLRHGSARAGVPRVLAWSLVLTVATSLGAAWIFAAGARWWTPELRYLVAGAAGIALFALANVASAVAVLLDNLFAARRAAQLALLRSLVAGSGKLVALAALASYSARNLYLATFVPMIAASAMFALIALPLVRREKHDDRVPGEVTVRSFFSYSAATYPSSLLAGAPPFFLPLIVLGLTTARETAFFYVAWSLVSVVLLLPTLISHMALSEGIRERPWEVAARARVFALAIVVPLVIALLLGAQTVLQLYGSAYAEGGATTLRALALSLVPWTFMAVNLGAFRAENRYQDLTVSMGLFAVLTLALPVVIGYRFGLIGVAAGWTIGISLTALFMELLARRLRAESAGQEMTHGEPTAAAADAPSAGVLWPETLFEAPIDSTTHRWDRITSDPRASTAPHLDEIETGSRPKLLDNLTDAEPKPQIVALSIAALLLAALVIVDFWQPARALATLLLGLVLPGLLLSYVVLPRHAPPALRAVLAVAGSLVISMLAGLILAGLFEVSRAGAGVCWATATVALATVGLARERKLDLRGLSIGRQLAIPSGQRGVGEEVGDK